jgi:hypothetical protein
MKATGVLRSFQMLVAICMVSTLGGYASSLDELTARADAIVIGTVMSRTEGGDSVSFSIDVKRVLKGDKALNWVDVSHPWNGLVVRGPAQTISATLAGIWFLRRTVSQSWDVLNVSGRNGIMASLFLPVAAASLVPAPEPANTSLQEILTLEVADGIEASVPGLVE